jgi:hypothetical protein
MRTRDRAVAPSPLLCIYAFRRRSRRFFFTGDSETAPSNEREAWIGLKPGGSFFDSPPPRLSSERAQRWGYPPAE